MICKFPGCVRGTRGRGFCHAHYQQWLRKNYNPDLLVPLRKKNHSQGKCVGPQCENDAISRDLCRRHYNQWYVRGKDLSKLTP